MDYQIQEILESGRDFTFAIDEVTGNIVVSNNADYTIWFFDVATQKFDLLAGNGEQGFHDGPLLESQFISISDIVIDQYGDIIVCDDNRIRKINLTDGIVTTITGKSLSPKLFNILRMGCNSFLSDISL